MKTIANKEPKFIKAFTVSVTVIILVYVTYGFYRIYNQRSNHLQYSEMARFADIEKLQLLATTSAAIVQNYYVDQQRVSSDALLELVLERLAALQVVDVTRTVMGQWQLHDGERTLLLPVGVVDAPRLTTTLLEVAAWLATNTEFTDRYDLQTTDDGIYYLLNELLYGLDSHSALLNDDEYNELKQGTEGQFGGIGIMVGIRDELLTVIKPLPNSPASRAGIKRRDRIINIDGRNTFELTLDQLVKHMRGDPDTLVNLLLLRSGDLSPRQLQIRREVVQVDSINSRRLRAGNLPVLYVQIENFSTRTATEIETALARFKRSVLGRYGMVLDLRGNPGGLLDQAVQVADLFISHGRILSTSGRREEIENASYTHGETDYPLIVLIDADSASASEIVAGALQDQERAFIIGQPSFGKGSVQTIFELPYGQALKLTVARYFTPSGRSIQETGIYPHIWMQPVTSHTDNHDLLGTYRYRNYIDSATQTATHTLLRSSYLRDAADLDAYEENRANDVELDAALLLLGKIIPQHRYGSVFSTQRYRQLPAALLQLLQRHSAGVESWLQQQHQIDWGSGEIAEQDFDLQLNSTVYGQEIVAGKTINIPCHLRNFSATALSRISLFGRANFEDFKSEEYLIGRVKKQADVEISFKIPVTTRPGVYKVEVGAALDGIVQQHSLHQFLLKVLPPQSPVLDVAIHLEEARTGQIEGKLEAGEYANIIVTVTNHGTIVAKDVTVKLLNLAGHQLNLLKEQQQLRQLAPGQQQLLRFPLHATQQLSSTTLPVGVALNSVDLAAAVKKQYTLDGAPQHMRALMLKTNPTTYKAYYKDQQRMQVRPQ